MLVVLVVLLLMLLVLVLVLLVLLLLRLREQKPRCVGRPPTAAANVLCSCSRANSLFVAGYVHDQANGFAQQWWTDALTQQLQEEKSDGGEYCAATLLGR